MSSARPRALFGALHTYGLAALWALTALCMAIDVYRDPYDPSLAGTLR